MDYSKEFLKLANLNRKFSEKCFIKLTKKLGEGYTGWDIDECELYRQKLMKLSKEKLTQKALVNISNYCSFLWYREEKNQKKLERELNFWLQV